jgi:acetyl esterase/lipase
MDKRKYSSQALSAIKERQYTINEQGLDVLVKPIPETDEAGVMDPRQYKVAADMTVGLKGMLAQIVIAPIIKRREDLLEGARQYRKLDKVNIPHIVDSVNMETLTVKNGDVDVPVRLYTPKAKKPGLQPVFYFIHGGGFIGGTMEMSDELCRLMVEKTGYITLQPDYRRAPEDPFPAGLDDCYAVLKWIYAHAKEFGGDPEKICIGGESAGANLATVCAMRQRDDGLNMAKVQAIYFPTADMAHMQENMAPQRKLYEVAGKQSKVINRYIDLNYKLLTNVIMGDHLKVKDDSIPYVSPSLGNLKGMVPAIILLDEYDLLRLEGEQYARKLKAAGVEVKFILYKGLGHGFANQVGIFPQAEDALEEIAGFMKDHLVRPK